MDCVYCFLAKKKCKVLNPGATNHRVHLATEIFSEDNTMKMWMFNCRQIARLVSESMDRELSPGRRLGVRFHLLMCRHCARYRKQLHLMRRLLRSRASTDAEYYTAAMNEQAKERLRMLIDKKSETKD
jgi:hypothetical protein